MLLKRISKDICLFGPKGSGKTMYMAYLGLLSYLTGETVYTNFRLKFPHIYLDTMEKIDNCYDGIVLLDDLEQWLSSRKWKSNQSQEILNSIILQGGKRKLTIIYSVKRPENIDLLLRDVTDYWLRFKMIPNFKAKSIFEFEYKSKSIENLMIQIELFNDELELINTTYLTDLEIYSLLYETTEEIQKLKIE